MYFRMNRNGKLDMKFQNLVSSIPKHLLLVSSINVPNFTSDSGNGEDVQNSNLESYLSSVKSDLAKHVPSDKYSTNSLPNKVVPVMYQLICLLLEDFKLSKGNFANGLIYLEDIIGTIEHIIKESKPYHQVVDMVARCKYKLAARKRNLQNNVEEEDYELKMNFLNRSVDLDMGLTALKELLMMKTIWQHYNMRSRLREGGSQLAEYLIQDFSDSEIMSPLDSRYVAGFNSISCYWTIVLNF